MPQFFTRHAEKQLISLSDDKLNELASWLSTEIENGLTFRRTFESIWRTCLQMYEGVPRLESRDTPIENAPNIEITVGAIACDTIYAQAIDMIFNTSPLVTVRAIPKSKDDTESVKRAKAIQRLLNWLAVSPDTGLRNAVETAILDDTQLGTGFIYIPWTEKIKKTKSSKVLSIGPKFYAIPIEDVIVPAGSYPSIESLPWIALRFFHTEHDVNALAKRNNWTIDNIQPINSKSVTRTTREQLGKHASPAGYGEKIFDICNVHCYFDIDDDGIDEDILVIWNHSGRIVMHVGFSSMDHRPIERMQYQSRAHMFYGMGILQMMQPYEEKLSDIHNYATLNVLLANARLWVGSEGLPETLKVWPGKYLQTPTPREDLIALQMADVYPSIWQDQMITMQLANQRVGINDIARPNDIPSRTPGITAMSYMQQVGKRFVPAFDSMRNAIAGALIQSLYRFQERLLSGDSKAEALILSILGYEDGLLVINTLRDENFDEQLNVELTASSAMANRAADRQDALMLANLLGPYYQRIIELIGLAANPQIPPEMRSVVSKVMIAAGEVIDRTIRTFDQVRDPSTFIVDIESELQSLNVSAQEQQMLGTLMQFLGGGQQVSGQQNATQQPVQEAQPMQALNSGNV